MEIQKEEDDFNAWFNKQTINAVPDADLSLQRLWSSLAWQAQAAKAQAVPAEFEIGQLKDRINSRPPSNERSLHYLACQYWV